jgi:hypothetical protein
MQSNNKRRRVWTHTINKGFIKDKFCVDTCPICRQLLSDYCLDCAANCHEIEKSCDQIDNLKKETKNIWLLLLLLYNRRVLPFDIAVLKKIYNYCLPRINIKGCDVCIILGKETF